MHINVFLFYNVLTNDECHVRNLQHISEHILLYMHIRISLTTFSHILLKTRLVREMTWIEHSYEIFLSELLLYLTLSVNDHMKNVLVV